MVVSTVSYSVVPDLWKKWAKPTNFCLSHWVHIAAEHIFVEWIKDKWKNQEDVILLLPSEGAETKSFSFSQPKSGFDCHVGIDNRRPERERGSVSSWAHQTLTLLVATLRLLSSLLTHLSFLLPDLLSLSSCFLRKKCFFPSLLSLAKMESLVHHSLERKVSLQRLFPLVWLQKPKEHDQTCPQPSQGSLAAAWFFQMGTVLCTLLGLSLVKAVQSVLLFLNETGTLVG